MPNRTSTRLSFFFTDIAILALVYSVIMLAGALNTAFVDGRIDEIWGEPTGGNHGPWRHYYAVRPMLFDAISYSLYAIMLITVGYFLCPNKKKLYLLAFAFVFWLLVMGSLYWLID